MADGGLKFRSHRFQAGDTIIPAEVLQDMLEACREFNNLAVAAPLEMVSTTGGLVLRLRGGTGGGGAGGFAIKIVSGGPGKEYVVDVYQGRYDDDGVEVTTASRLVANATAFVRNGIDPAVKLPVGEWYFAVKVGAHYEFDADIWRSDNALDR